MTYPHVIQLETQARRAEAQARLAQERRLARTPRRHFVATLRGPRAATVRPAPACCDAA